MKNISRSAIIASRVLDMLASRLNAKNSDGKFVLTNPTRKSIAILAPIVEKVNTGKRVTIEEQTRALRECLSFSTSMTGKMAGITSISTSSAVNPICCARACDKTSICSKCYARDSLIYRSNVNQNYIINFVVLNLMEYSLTAWKSVYIPCNGIFRIESFGDVASVTQCVNYLRLAKTHKSIRHIGIWSKNLGYWYNAFQRESKPNNVVFNASSPVLNTITRINPDILQYIDHVFTVYNAEHAIDNDVNINCGDRICAHCMHCYTRGNGMQVSEILKSDAKKYYKAIGMEYKGRR